MTEQDPNRAAPPVEEEGYSDTPIPLADAGAPAPIAVAPDALPQVIRDTGGLPRMVTAEEPLPQAVPVALPKAVPVAGGESSQAMEERMRRIEDALAALVENQAAAKPKGAFGEASELLADARKILPVAKKALAAKDRAENAVRAAAGAAADERWVLVEAFAEMRDIFSMYIDRRYEVSWACWTFPALALVAMILFYFTLGAIPIFGIFLERLADLFVAFIVYKIVRREAALYREAVAAHEKATT